MKKIHQIVYIFNLMIGIFLLINEIVISEFNVLTIFFSILLLLIYIILTIKYFKNFNYEKIDLPIIIMYTCFIIFIFTFNIIYQINNDLTFSINYFNKIIYVIHLIFLIYPIKKLHLK